MPKQSPEARLVFVECACSRSRARATPRRPPTTRTASRSLANRGRLATYSNSCARGRSPAWRPRSTTWTWRTQTWGTSSRRCTAPYPRPTPWPPPTTARKHRHTRPKVAHLKWMPVARAQRFLWLRASRHLRWMHTNHVFVANLRSLTLQNIICSKLP